MAKDLLSIADAIDEKIGQADSRIGIAVETDEDEAFVVGTVDGLLRFASALVRSAASCSDTAVQIADGIEVRWQKETQSLFDPMSEIAISAECLLESQESLSDALRFFQKLSPRASGATSRSE